MDIDEVPIGGGLNKAGAMDDEFAQSNDQPQFEVAGSLEERLLNKTWGVRAAAYDELNLLFKGAHSSQDQIFKDHVSLWKKYLNDSNPGGLEKCLDAFQPFIDLGDPKVVLLCQNEVIKILIEKCIGHAKPTIKQKGLECFNLLFEVTESFDDSIETIIESLNSKTIKIGQSALIALNSWLSNFGSKKIKLKPFLKIVETSANSSNPQIRSEAMNFYKESYKWLGAGLKPLIADLKKQQLDELDKAFEEVKDQPKTTRLTRTEKIKQKDLTLDQIIQQQEEQKNQESSAYDLADAVDLLKVYTPEWQDNILGLTKWNEKKALLEQLISSSNVPKIQEGDYNGLVQTIKKLIGDSNQVVSQYAIKAIGNLAKGLRGDFEPYCKDLMSILIGKFKEKKTQIIDDVHIVLDNLTDCTNLESLSYQIVEGISDKAPTLKKNTMAFLDRFLQKTYIDVLQSCCNEIIQSLIKSTDDQAGDVRDAALYTLGILKGRLGDSYMSKFLQDFIPQKLAKVNEAAQIVKPSKYDKPDKTQVKKVVAAAPPKLGTKTVPAKKKTPAVVKEESKQGGDNDVEMIVEDQIQPGSDSIPHKTEPFSGGFDDMPIGGGSNKMQFDDMPIGGNKQPSGGFEDKPLGAKGGYNLDDLEMAEQALAMTMGSSKPPKQGGPPKRLAAAAKAKETPSIPFEQEGEQLNNDDVLMSPKEETKSKPPPLKPKPKPEASKKDTAATSAKPQMAKKEGGGGGGAPEEDLGAGLSKEEAEAKVNETFSAENVAKCEESKWQDKVEGFKGIGEQIIELQVGADVVEAVVKYIKIKMKEWKESNVNLVKESINIFSVIAKNCDKVNKRSVSIMMPFLSDKIGDVKVVNSVLELLIALAELVTPKFVANQIIKHASNAKSPKVLQESCNILTTLTEDFGVIQMPLKEMIEYAKLCTNHQNPQVRIAAMALFCVMYKQAGETIKNFLKDIKESTMKLIQDEFEKITPFKKGEFVGKRGIKEEPAEDGGGGKKKGGGDTLDDLLGAREDISKHINPKLVANFKSTDWKVRNEAANQIREILTKANMRILPAGLNELMDNMKLRMSDSNKAVMKAYIQLIAVIVEALGIGAKQYAKKVLTSMLQNLADKQSLVRNDVLAATDKWAEHIGADQVINYLGPLVLQENPEMRTEALQWIVKNKDSIKQSDVKELIKPFIQCLLDKVPSIRQLAEQLICEIMPVTGYAPFQAATTDLKPAVQNQIKPILEKVKLKVGATQQSQSAPDNMNSSIGQRPATAAPTSTGPTLKEKEKEKEQVKDSNNSSLKAGTLQNKPKGQLTATNKEDPTLKANSTFGEAAKKRAMQQTPGSKQRADSKEPARAKFGSSISTFQQQEQEIPQQEGLNVIVGLKNKRAEQDKKNKWQHEDIKGEQIDRLKIQTASCLSQTIATKMFSNDIKQHNECIDQFFNLVENQPDQIKEILDIIFKWGQVKMADSANTQFAVKIFDFFNILFLNLEESEYQLLDFEAGYLIPLLCDKTGINNAILKDKVKKLVKLTFNIYDKQKCYQQIIHYGLNSKNLRTISECLDEISEFIRINGIDYSAEKDIKLTAKLADNSDKGVRENALKVLAEVYKFLDNDIWRVIGEVTPKVQGLIEQRFKMVKKNNLASSSSQSNFFQQDNQLSENKPTSPRASEKEPSKTQIGFGLKKQSTAIVEVGIKKNVITPRNDQLKFTKGASQNQKLESQAVNNLSKSINPFNNSNLSNNDEPKKSSQGIQKKSDMLRKTPTQDPPSGISKRLVPLTQRIDSGNGEFSALNRTQIENSKGSLIGGFGGMKITKTTSIQDDKIEDVKIQLTHAVSMDMSESEAQYFDIMKHIQQLKHGDLSKRVDSLVSLNELISAIEVYKDALVKSSNDLVNAFTHVLMDIFDRPIEEIPLRFAKYFITIVLKACSCKEIMREASEEKVFELAEQLLTRLLIDNLDKVGENKEGELILKNLNSSMLRLLENCNHTYIFCVLFNLLRKYKDFHKMPKLPGLIIKCLLKLSKILEKLIDKLEIEKILIAIHEYLVAINHDNKTQNDEMGIRIVKTVTNEIVKLKRESIWEAYKVVENHEQQDSHICRWIQIILKSLQTQGASSSGQITATNSGEKDDEIRSIIEELRNSEEFEHAIPKLYKFLENHPQTDLNEYLQDCSKTFQSFIKQNLEKFKALQCKQIIIQQFIEEDANHNINQPEMGLMNSLKSTCNSDEQPQEDQQTNTQNRFNDYHTKLSTFKQKFSQKTGGDNTGNNKDNQQSTPNLNTSFSAMNSRLAQKWAEINKNKQDPIKGEPQQMSSSHMSSTMGGFGGSQNTLAKAGAAPVNLNQSTGNDQDQNMQGATNQDLNKRLAEMKAKLQALKKK